MSANVAEDLARGWSLPADSAPIIFSDDAVLCYGERVRPTLDQDRVRLEMSRLLASVRITHQKPRWLTTREPATAYLMISDDICAPLHLRGDELHAATVVYKDMVEGKRRQDWAKAGQTFRAGKKAAKRSQKLRRGKPAAEPDQTEWER